MRRSSDGAQWHGSPLSTAGALGLGSEVPPQADVGAAAHNAQWHTFASLWKAVACQLKHLWVPREVLFVIFCLFLCFNFVLLLICCCAAQSEDKLARYREAKGAESTQGTNLSECNCPSSGPWVPRRRPRHGHRSMACSKFLTCAREPLRNQTFRIKDVIKV
eukprot:6081713-Amphidinium_carterae.1